MDLAGHRQAAPLIGGVGDPAERFGGVTVALLAGAADVLFSTADQVYPPSLVKPEDLVEGNTNCRGTTASGATIYRMFMLNNAGTADIASPSVPDSDSDGFAVAYGPTAPPAPKS